MWNSPGTGVAVSMASARGHEIDAQVMRCSPDSADLFRLPYICIKRNSGIDTTVRGGPLWGRPSLPVLTRPKNFLGAFLPVLRRFFAFLNELRSCSRGE